MDKSHIDRPMNRTKQAEEAPWEAALKGDRNAFNRLAEPHLDDLKRFAEREIRYHQYLGHFPEDDLKPEDLIGEALLRAWRTRRNRPRDISIKAWLLGILQRVVQREVWKQARSENMETISLESPVPSENGFDDDQSFWEWHQPDDLTRWEDVIEGHSVSPEDVVEFEEEETYDLSPRSRKVLLLHEQDRLPPQEVAYIMNLSVKETLDTMGSARGEVKRKKAAK
ncbi:MAG: hypothetical protein JRJ03_09695 [Deltaproteobacteria bacterium]|nr:hypothetical protein [Deltaproteobacteria bacterium]